MIRPPLCIESIRVENGQLWHVEQHNQRLNHTRRTLYRSVDEWDLFQFIEVPTWAKIGLFKCRITYGLTLEKIEFEPYEPKIIKVLKVVEASHLNYEFKFQNRTLLNELFAQRGVADDVLLVKNGFVTDTSYANIAFFDGLHWLTPSQPLLAGTRRALLLQQNQLVEKQIRVQEIFTFSRTRIFNAMFDYELPICQWVK